MGFLVVIIVMFALMYLLVMRPQRARQQAHQRLLAQLGVGDEVLTAGGLFGTVEEIDEDGDVWIEIAEGITVRIARRSVTAVTPVGSVEDEEEPAEEPAEEEEEPEEEHSAAGEPR